MIKTAIALSSLALALAVVSTPAQAQFSKKKNDPQGAAAGANSQGAGLNLEPVSYTHLDVYKRQAQGLPRKSLPDTRFVARQASHRFATHRVILSQPHARVEALPQSG